MNVVILDTGCANLNSVKSAIGRHGYEPVVSRDPDVVLRADKLFLPGVGTAQAAMDQIRERELIELVKACTQPVLGICLGMQLLFQRSEEGDVDGLGLLPGVVRRMVPAPGLRVPHMGWNRLRLRRASPLMAGIDDGARAYFVHGYAVEPGADCVAEAEHGTALGAVVERGRIAGAQFHPERSGAVGARLLKNFIEYGLQ